MELANLKVYLMCVQPGILSAMLPETSGNEGGQ